MQTLLDGSVTLTADEYKFIRLQLTTLQETTRALINDNVNLGDAYAVLLKEKEALYKILASSTGAGWAPAALPLPVIVPAPLPADTTGIIFSDDFSSGDLLKKRSDGKTFWINGSQDDKDDYATVPSDIWVSKDEDGRNSLKVYYAGTLDLLGDARPQLNFELGDNYTDLWISLDVFIPANYYHRIAKGTSNNKFFIIDNIVGSQYFDFELWPLPDGSSRMSFNSSEDRIPKGHIFPTPDCIFASPADRGKWHRWAFHIRVASTEVSKDGVAEVWKNGVKVMNFQNLPHHTTGVNYFSAGYILGAANSGFTNDTELKLAMATFSKTPLTLN